jgi:uncharacterized protein (DUF885 family)
VSEIELAERYDRMNSVVEQMLMGNNPTQIAKQLTIPRKEVLELIDEWKTIVRDDSSARDRAKEAVSGADQHYAMLIKEAWKTVEDADIAGQLGVKATSLKLIADIEAKRIAMLQQLGLLDNAELAGHLAETERKQDILIGILKDISAEYPEVRNEIMRRLSQISNKVEEVIVQDNVTPLRSVENADGV